MSEVNATATDELSPETIDSIIKELELERRRAAEFELIVYTFTGHHPAPSTPNNPDDPEVIGYFIRQYLDNVEHDSKQMQREIANLTTQLRTERAVNRELARRLQA